MNQKQWQNFCTFKNEFRDICELWKKQYSEILKPFQKQIAIQDKVPEYPIENPVVYNTALDKILQSDDIKLILIGDNPGKNEQLEINKKYLVGQSGKIAEGFFKKNPELQTDFRKNVIILNKTPIHTAKTKELLFLANQNEEIAKLIKESQIWMAKKTVELHKNLDCKMWLVGYGEVKEKGVFQEYKKAFLCEYFKDEKSKFAYKKVFVYQHFSMNRFLIDLNEFSSSKEFTNKTLEMRLNELGTIHKKQIFGL